MSKRTPAVEVHSGLVTVNGNEGLLFDRRPMEVGFQNGSKTGFRLRGRSVEPVGRPTIKEFQSTLAAACEFHESSPWWIGGLVAYGENRGDWKEKLSQAMAITKLAKRTLFNLGYVYRHSTEATRALAPSPEHAKAVAALPEVEQVDLLQQARREELTVPELRLEVRSRKRRKVIEGQAVLEGLYRVIYADPPWVYNDRPPSGSGAHEHYDGMSIEDLCKLPVQAHALPNSVLFMWVTAPMLYANPGPREVIEAWGFTPKAQRIWDKVDHNWGHYVSVRHELLIIATRGSCTPDRPTPMLDSVVVERADDDSEHSAKPESFRKDIERLYDGPYVEIFARAPIPGWATYGDDAALWASENGGVKELVTT